MSKWVPPIPTEKLYSAPAMKLGAGLALLVWCYDGIERDGTFKLELDKAATALGKPYRTVKEWWHLLRDGPFFSNVRDRGKLGFVVTFDREWVEWRVMASNYPTEDVGQRHQDVFEDKPIDIQEPVQGPVKVASRSDERHPDVFEAPAYKVLNTTDQTCSPSPQAANGTHPVKKPKTAKPEKPPVPIEVRQAIATGSGIDLKAGLDTDIKQVNTVARRLWDNYRKPDETAESMVKRIRHSGKYIRRTQHPYNSNPDQRIPPAAHVKFWLASQADYEKEQAQTNGAHVNGVPLPPFDYSQLDKEQREREERRKIAAERRQAAIRKAGAS